MTLEVFDQAAHRFQLNNVIVFSAHAVHKPTAEGRDDAMKSAAHAFDQCLRHIESRTACGEFPGRVVTQFLRRRDWRVYEAPTELWARYLESGLVNVDEAVPYAEAIDPDSTSYAVARRSPTTIHPLEAAIINGNLATLRALLDAGADVTRVPVAAWDLSVDAQQQRSAGAGSGALTNGAAAAGTVLAPITEITEIHGFIQAMAPTPEIAQLMSALVARSTMERRIRQVEVPTAVAGSPPRARRQARAI